MKDYAGKAGRRFNNDQIAAMRKRQIRGHEQEVVKNIEQNVMKPGGPAERMMGHWTKTQTLRKAEKRFDSEFGSGSGSDSSKGVLKKGKKGKKKK